MDATFRRAYHEAEQALAQALAPERGADAARLGEDLWAVARAVDASPSLRRNLADPSREAADKAGLAQRLLSGKVGDDVLGVVGVTVGQRWAQPGDVIGALERLGVEAVLTHAQRNGRLAQVEDELFRFGRVVASSSELQGALGDRRADAAARSTLVDRLLSVKAAPESVRLAKQAVSGTRGRRFDHALEAFLEQAAAHQDQVTATVTSAVQLSQEQHDRLARALSTQYGRQVHTQVVIDEDVVGGIRVEIGDEVIDGTVSHRLAEAHRLLTS
ncbi:F0F1 ATP synthase subunit delta [Ornithinimicrobium avium]|uniref:ATP synthase subunit delta n=1 Tax=Ornithinimicrobium avium TaxID=2283195 RepID=A0A345NM71_9MICO|nr:F0F1 ATP synthase subunit delta [Ornithinimicrobium avium]AXH96129.1 F0F1 ATP synthase subunit delta [Ornithinimicrobium avium]